MRIGAQQRRRPEIEVDAVHTRVQCAADVGRDAAHVGQQARAQAQAGQHARVIERARRSCRRGDLDVGDAKVVERQGNGPLIGRRKVRPGELLALAQGRLDDQHALAHPLWPSCPGRAGKIPSHRLPARCRRSNAQQKTPRPVRDEGLARGTTLMRRCFATAASAGTGCCPLRMSSDTPARDNGGLPAAPTGERAYVGAPVGAATQGPSSAHYPAPLPSTAALCCRWQRAYSSPPSLFNESDVLLTCFYSIQVYTIATGEDASFAPVLFFLGRERQRGG